MPSTFFLVGPTAVGKTELAVELAERIGAEIISADALQAYQGFDVLTAKPTPEQQRRVAHHLLSYVPTHETYNVARFVQNAQARIESLRQQGKSALVVGGNGLYAKALTHGLAPLPPAQPALRAELEALDPAVLLRWLRKKDPATASTIDSRNKRRLIRALEVCLTTGEPFSIQRTQWDKTLEPAKIVGVFLNRQRDDLVHRINRRTEQMFARGAVEEVRSQGYAALSSTAERIIGLPEIRQHLAGLLSLAHCQDRIGIATRQYAKRQVTWFKRESNFEMVSLPVGTATEPRVLARLVTIFRAM